MVRPRVVRQLVAGLFIGAVAAAHTLAQQPGTTPPVSPPVPPQPNGGATELAQPGVSGDSDALPVPDIFQQTPDSNLFTPDFGDQSQVPAQQALDQGSGQQFQGESTLQLAATPKMLGDFFGNVKTCVTVGDFFGEAVHQTISSGSAFANNNISLITTDPGTGKTVFVGGPGGLLPESFFLPSIPPPLPDVVTGLTANDTDGSQLYTAVVTSETVNVFDNPADADPSIPNAPVYNTFAVNKFILPIGNPGDLVGRVRIQDNNSAMPQDRVYFDYNYFHNVQFTNNGVDVNRFVPGIEKTFWGGMGSLEVRVPMAATLNSDTYVGQGFETSEYQFGNVTLIPKILLWASDEEAFAAGMGIALPTANDIQIFGDDDPLLRVNNQSVHLVPFLGYLYAPQRTNYFVHAFLSVDVDTSGNDVEANVTGDGLENIGVFRDQGLLSASASLGKVVYRNNCRASRVKALAWTTELHYTATVTSADVIDDGAFLIGTPRNDLSLLNGTIGGHMQLQKSIVTVGYTLPINSNDRVFDGEFRMFINRPF